MTIIDAATVVDGTVLRSAVVVLGSGPAGITVARDLAAAGVGVVVVESGGVLPSPEGQDLAGGEVAGDGFRFARRPVRLQDTRLRALGGSSGHWNGVCSPLDAADFRPRPAIGRPGWPFELAELQEWYRRAEETCEIGPGGFDVAAWFAALGESSPGDGTITPTLYRFSAPTRFGERYRDELQQAEACTVLLRATAVDLAVTDDGRRVHRVDAVGPAGRVSVEAELVVLAMGGIDVPRLLLASAGAGPAGVANSSGLVGVGFMEHPHVRLGRLALALDPDIVRALRPHDGAGPFTGGRGWAALRLADDEIVERGLLGAALALDPEDHPTALVGEDLAPGIGELLSGVGHPATFGSATLRCEQLPVSENTVRLGDVRDAVGLPRPVVQWELGRATRESIDATVSILADSLGRAGFGRLELGPGGAVGQRRHVEIGCHPMGTARMSDDPDAGVVDRDCRCHDVDNLYVAGSAVYPTGGFANPTLTIVALAHRLAAAIIERLAG